MSEEKKLSKKKRIAILVSIAIAIFIALLPFRVTRNGLCKYTGYNICIKTDFGSSRYDSDLYYKAIKEKL